jgi:hemerythrin
LVASAVADEALQSCACSADIDQTNTGKGRAMPLITWSDTMSVGVARIDKEHQKLIELINLLHAEMSHGKSNQVMGKVLEELIAYTKTHFATEETLFRTHGYPDATAHKNEHDGLTKKVLDVQAEFKAGKTFIGVATLNFLRDWLTQHILKQDMAYKLFFGSKGVK